MIRVFISEENLGYVWNANGKQILNYFSPRLILFHVTIFNLSADWLRIRQEFRIVGNLIGSLSNYPRQDALKGLPLCLLPEEITLLHEKNLITLVRCPSLATEPSDSLFEAFTKQEQCFHDSQVYR